MGLLRYPLDARDQLLFRNRAGRLRRAGGSAGIEARQVDRHIRASLLYACDHRDEAWNYIVHHAQEMESEIIRRHIDTFVNEYSNDVGAGGEQAVRTLVSAAAEQAGIAVADRPLFWTDTMA